MHRKTELEKLKSKQFDVCVIGAGASGAGVALDAQLRGLSVCLLDRGDFVSETSAKSTKLIHGGVRYLEQAFKNLDLGQLKQVKHGLAERKFLLANGSHVSRPLGIITPVFSLFEAVYYTIGLKIYGWFAKKDHLPAARWVSKKETLLLAPNISNKIHSAVMYFDGQLDDARFAFALSQTAHQQGVATVNYVKVNDFGFDQNGKLNAANCTDILNNETFSIKSRLFINCTGPFADDLRLKANPSEEKRITPAKGVHIVVPRRFFDSERAMLIPKTKDGRLIFMIPFGTAVMVGTTDTKYNEIDKEPVLELEEVDFLLDTVKDYLKEIPTKADITSGFGGLRPLISAKSKNPNETKSLLRDHEVEHDVDSGLISLLGGKWTTYRLMAEDTVTKICEILLIDKASSTHEFRLIGCQNRNPEKPDHFELEIYTHLIHTYGDKTADILKICKNTPEMYERLHKDQPYIKAEVLYCLENEMILKPRDYLARRTRFELMDWQACSETIAIVANLMSEKLGWSAEKTQKEITEYKTLIAHFKRSSTEK
jgi:glycerol-3-phosphate dehydrogenase